MSGVSSAGSEGASTLGPLPEEGVLRPLASACSNQEAASLRKSPTASSPNRQLKSRRVSAPAPPIPDICQLSPPSVQFVLGTTPPIGGASTAYGASGRRRTSSSSSCGTPPPPVQWQISPNSPVIGATGGSGRITPTMTSPVRRHTVGSRAIDNVTIAGQPSGSTPMNFYNNPNGSTLSPILGSPNKTTEGVTSEGAVDINQQAEVGAMRQRSGSNTSCGRPRSGSNTSKAVMQWQGPSDAAECQLNRAGSGTVCMENLSEAVTEAIEGGRRRSTELQFVSGRNVVLNYGTQQPFGGIFDRSSKFTLLYGSG